MAIKNKNIITAALIAVLLIIGIIGFNLDGNTNPVRVHFKTKGGPVIFTHKKHIEEYEGDCMKCHHYSGMDANEASWRCRDCHMTGGAFDTVCKDNPVHKQCIGANCISCHLDNGLEANDCGFCHK